MSDEYTSGGGALIGMLVGVLLGLGGGLEWEWVVVCGMIGAWLGDLIERGERSRERKEP